MSGFDDQDKIHDFLRREVSIEESYWRSFEMDPYTRVAYLRMRELYWTVSRLLRNIEAAFGGKRSTPQHFSFAGVVALQKENPRIFIDATDLLTTGKVTGIQRVVREIARNGVELGLALPVSIDGDRLVAACHGPDARAQIDYRAGDILLLLDAGWNRFDDYPELLRAFRRKGGVVVACGYDLFPLLYPTLYSRGLVANFQVWMDQVLLQSDAVVAISHSVAESFSTYVSSIQRKPRAGMRLGWWRLGADFVGDSQEAANPKVVELTRGAPFFLSVGTLEMRKGYPVALDAFERLWAEGIDANYVIVGRPGWNAAAFEERLRKHSQIGKRLFWLRDSSDADLRLLYEETKGVVLASFAEGFGLPLIEAAHFGKPIIASDIDVFREVGGKDVRFFDVLDAAGLAVRVKETLSEQGAAPEIAHSTWRESTEELMTMLRSGAFQRTLD
jgi:glycosyltransferase involved in cell wall biosynthesis